MVEFFKEKTYVVQRVDVDPNTGCWNWNRSRRAKNSPYAQGHMWGKTWNMHKLSYILWKGSVPDGMVVRHICNNPICCNPEHLQIGTQMDNVLDCMMADRHCKGTRNGNAKLSERQVLEIAFKYYANIANMSQLGSDYGISRVAVRYIINGKLWSHVTGIIQ